MGFQSGRRQRTTRVAFTLVELLLVVVLLGLLFSAVVFSLDSLQRGAQLEEGAGQVETLLRFARARAAATGRLVRITFGNSDLTPGASSSATSSTNQPSGSPNPSSESGMVVEWEPDPIGAPGRFEILREASSYLDQIGALVRVEGWNSPEGTSQGAASSSVGMDPAAQPTPTGSTAAIPLSDTNAPAGPRPPLFFYPDGSSDFAELVVRSRNDDERRSVILSLSGLTGAIRQRWESPESNGAPADAATGSAANATAQATAASGGGR
jgi:type II secretory pathway pseudopilin PulG